MISYSDGSIKLVDPARVVRVADVIKDLSAKQLAKQAPSISREYWKAVEKRILTMLRKLDQVNV
jgi:hypothetical protein